MRKLLSILASVGLVATASSSVVSCVKKDTTPTYNSISDIESWSFTQGTNDLIPDISDSPKSIILKSDSDSFNLIVGSVASRFKNPSKLVNDSKSWSLHLDQLSKSNDVTKYTAYFVTQKQEQSSTQFVIGTTKATVFNVSSDLQAYHIDTTDDESNTLLATLRNISIAVNNNMQSAPAWASRMAESTTMMDMDAEMFDLLTSDQVPPDGGIYVPNLNDASARYKSIYQQIVLAYTGDLSGWNNKLKLFNEQVIKNIQEKIKGHSGWTPRDLKVGDAFTEGALDMLKIKDNIDTFTTQPSTKLGDQN